MRERLVYRMEKYFKVMDLAKAARAQGDYEGMTRYVEMAGKLNPGEPAAQYLAQVKHQIPWMQADHGASGYGSR